MGATLNPLAGKPAPNKTLIDVPRLITAYYTEFPDPSVPAQRRGVRDLRAPRRLVRRQLQRGARARRSARRSVSTAQKQGINGPLFLGADSHALSAPAFVSALEVLAANGVQVVISAGGEFTPTPAVSHAILVYNRGRTSGTRGRHRHHAVPQSAGQRRIQVQPAERRPRGYGCHRLDRKRGQPDARGGHDGSEAHAGFAGATRVRRRTSTTIYRCTSTTSAPCSTWM